MRECCEPEAAGGRRHSRPTSPQEGLRKKVDFLVTIWRRFSFVEVVHDGMLPHRAGQKGAQSETYVMKTHQKPLLGFLTLLALLWAPHLASGYYDPGAQRWITRDPIDEQGGVNLFAYVASNPINRLDLLGLAPGYGNPVSGPTGPVGPSNPYAPGWPYYPKGFCYKPGPQKSIDPDCFRNCMSTWLGGNIWNYGIGVAGAGAASAVGSAPVWFAGIQLPAYWVGGYHLGLYAGSSTVATVGIGIGAAVVWTGGILAAAGVGWAAGTAIQCAVNCYR
jgi:hypothetical protein